MANDDVILGMRWPPKWVTKRNWPPQWMGKRWDYIEFPIRVPRAKMVDMKITVTYQELADIDRWDDFVDMRGMNPYCRHDGQVADDEEFTLTLKEAEQLGLLRQPSTLD